MYAIKDTELGEVIWKCGICSEPFDERSDADNHCSRLVAPELDPTEGRRVKPLTEKQTEYLAIPAWMGHRDK